MDEASTALSADFVYNRLDDAANEIRLLRILPLSTENDIICELTSHVLDEVEDKYTAFSYTWGEPEPTKQIRVNGSPFEVRYNSWFALKQMLYHNRVDEFFWMDAICIDQNFAKEKSIQIQQMGRIYSKAVQVAACIGDEGPDSAFCRNMTSRRAIFGAETDVEEAAYAFFLRRPYFHRIWTVQECLLSKLIEIYVGFEHFPFDDIPTIDEDGTYTLGDYISVRLGFKHFSDDICDTRSNGKRAKDLANVIFWYGSRSCHEPRDRIYGFLALIPDSGVQRLQVNYEKPLLRVLFDYVSMYDMLDDKYAHFARIRSKTDIVDICNAREELIEGEGRAVLRGLGKLIHRFLTDQQFADDLDFLFSSNLERRGISFSWVSSLPCITIRSLEPDLSVTEFSTMYATVRCFEDVNDARNATGTHYAFSAHDPYSHRRISIGDFNFEVPGFTRSDDLVFRLGYAYGEIYFVCRRRSGASDAYDVLGPARRVECFRPGRGYEGFNDVDFKNPHVRIRIHPVVLVALALQNLVTLEEVTFPFSLGPNWLALNEIYLPEDVVRASSTTDQPLIQVPSVE